MTRRRLFLGLLLMFTMAAHAGAAVPVIVQLSGVSSIASVANSLGATVLDAIPDANIYLLNVPVSIPPYLASLLGIQWQEANTVLLPTWVSSAYSRSSAARRPTGTRVSRPGASCTPGRTGLFARRRRDYCRSQLPDRCDPSGPGRPSHRRLRFRLRKTQRVCRSESIVQRLHGSIFQWLHGPVDSGFMDQSSTGFMDSLALPVAGGNPAYSHATLCAGVLARAIAPDSTIMPLRVFDGNGQTDLFTIAKAIRYAVQHGAQVVNMSFGTLTNSNTIRSSVNYALASNVTLTASAGNNNTTSPQYPAA